MLSAAVGLMIGLSMFLIALYYFLCDGSELMAATEKLIPIQVEYQRQLIHEFNRVMQAVVTATMLSAIAQGAATSALLFLVGFHSFFLLFVVATFASLIPIAGTWMVWGPFAAWLAYQGSWGSAIFLTIVGIAVIGTMDNVIKAYVLQNDTSLHPLLAFVSVFGAMQVMGLWGIFIGPIVACCLHTLVKIFNAELNAFSNDSLAAAAAAADDTQKLPELSSASTKVTAAGMNSPSGPENTAQ
jgi:predicted PurR-regulated permease PerM